MTAPDRPHRRSRRPAAPAPAAPHAQPTPPSSSPPPRLNAGNPPKRSGRCSPRNSPAANSPRSGPARKAAGFPTGKTFDSWDETISSIPPPTQRSLQTLEWIANHENLVVCGPSGTGKSHLLEALGHAAIDAGHHVAWFSLESLGALVPPPPRR